MLEPLSHGQAPSLDRRTAQRLKRGALALEARLDLHGHSQDEARPALARFLGQSYERGLRCVLVITGKGRFSPGTTNRPRDDSWHSPRGVLREMVPVWLNEPPNRARVLSFSYAQPKDGGDGALYVLLKRQRET